MKFKLRPLSQKERLILNTIIFIIIVFIGIVIAAISWFSRDLPSMARLEMIEPSLKTRILASDSTVIKEFYEQNRILLPLDLQQFKRHLSQWKTRGSTNTSGSTLKGSLQ